MNSDILAVIKSRDPHEREFHQAVGEGDPLEEPEDLVVAPHRGQVQDDLALIPRLDRWPRLGLDAGEAGARRHVPGGRRVGRRARAVGEDSPQGFQATVEEEPFVLEGTRRLGGEERREGSGEGEGERGERHARSYISPRPVRFLDIGRGPR